MLWIVVTAVVIVGWYLHVRKRGNLVFWKLARRYPYAVRQIFEECECWKVFRERPEEGFRAALPPGEWAGPFKLVLRMEGDRPVAIFGKVPDYETSQREFVGRMKSPGGWARILGPRERNREEGPMDIGHGALRRVKGVLVGAIVLLLVGFVPTISGTIPDHASILVFPERGEWVPMQEVALVAFRDSIGNAQFNAAMKVPSTWRVVKDGALGELELHDDIREMDSWTITAPRRLISAFLFGNRERWRDDGSWIY